MTEFTNFGGAQQSRIYAICSAGSDAVLSEFTYVTSENFGAASNEKTVACPAGSRAIGGVGTTAAIPASNSVAQPYSYRNLPVGPSLDPTTVATGAVRGFGVDLRTQRSGPLAPGSTADSPSGTDAGDAFGGWYAAARRNGPTSTAASFTTVAVCVGNVAVTPLPDTTAPDTIAGKGPKKKASFSFSSSEPGSSFECALDKQAAKPA